MPLIITLTLKKPELFTTADDIQPIGAYFIEKMMAYNLRVVSLSPKMGCAVTTDKTIIIKFETLVTKSDAAANYLMRELCSFIIEIGLDSICYLSGLSSRPANFDIIYDLTIINHPTLNNILLQKYNIQDSELPEKFICRISSMIMDSPCYFALNPEVKYDKKQLKQWLFKQDQLKNPFTNTPVTVGDIIDDNLLQNEIHVFVSNKIQEKLIAKKNESSKSVETNEMANILKRYQLTYDGQNTLDLALRNASAINNIDDVNFLVHIKKCDVNIQAGGSKKTPLHWAVKNGHNEIVKILRQAGARADIKDSSQKTAIDYAKENNDSNILLLLDVEVPERELSRMNLRMHNP